MKPVTEEKGGRILIYGLIVMTVTHTLTHVFQNIHTALFPILRGPQEFNLSLQQLGIIAAIPPLCQVILGIPVGVLSDRYGSKRMLIISMVVAAVGALIASQAVNPVMLTLAVSLVYINTVIYHPASFSFTTRLFGSSDRVKALGIHGGGGVFGMSIGPISVSILMTFLAFGWRQVYLFWFFPLIIGILLVMRIKSEPMEDAKDDVTTSGPPMPKKDSLFTPSLTAFLIYTAITVLGAQMIGPFLTIFLVDEGGLSPSIAFLVLGSSSLVGLIGGPLGGFLASKFGDKRWLMVSLTFAYFFLGLAMAVPNVYVFSILYIAYGFCNTLGMAADSAIVASLSPSRKRGLGYAMYFLPSGIMGVVGPILAAFIASIMGLSSIFITALAIYLVGLTALKFGVRI